MAVVKLASTIVVDFETHNPTTGTAAVPDSVSVSVFEDTTAAAFHTPTPDVRTGLTGANFVEIPVTAGNGYEDGKSYNVYATATFGAITRHKVIASFVVTTQDIDDLATQASVDTIDGIVDAILLDTAEIGAAGAGLTAIFDNQTVEGTVTGTKAFRAILALALGKVTGGGTTTITYRDSTDAKNRIVLTVDTNGNRSVVSSDLT